MHELPKVRPHRELFVEPDMESRRRTVSNSSTLTTGLQCFVWTHPTACLKNATAKRFPRKSCLCNLGQSAKRASLLFSASLERVWKPVLKPLRFVLLPAKDGIVVSYILRLCSMTDEWWGVIKCRQQQRDCFPAHFCLYVPDWVPSC